MGEGRPRPLMDPHSTLQKCWPDDGRDLVELAVQTFSRTLQLCLGEGEFVQINTEQAMQTLFISFE